MGNNYVEKLFWDGKYVGQILEDKREGFGTMQYFTGETYEGKLFLAI